MERLGVAAAQCESPNILGIERLPAHRYFRLLRIIRAMRCGNKRLDPDRQHSRGIVAVPFFPLGKVYLQAIKPGKVPRWTGERNPYFLVNSPDIPVHPEALPVHRANRVKGCIERITIAGKPRRVILAAYGKGDRSGGKVKQVTVEGGIVYRQLILTGVMQRDINSCSGVRGVLVEKAS